MATDNTNLVQALIDGGLTPAASRVIANAIANAATPQFSKSRDIADATPTEQLRLIDGDTRRYVLTNLDYSSENPYQTRLHSHPGRYDTGPGDHPYKDSQPVAPVPPLQKTAVASGDYIDVATGVEASAAVATVSLKLGNRSGTHMRLNPATKAIDAVPLTMVSPQGLVTASVSEDSDATSVELSVRQLQDRTIVQADGTAVGIRAWPDASVPTSTVFTQWAKDNLLDQTSWADILIALGAIAESDFTTGNWTPQFLPATGNALAQALAYDTANTVAFWAKFKRLVFITGRCKLSSLTGANSQQVGLGPLPFTPQSSARFHGSGSISYRQGWGDDGGTVASVGPTGFYIVPGDTTAPLTSMGGGTTMNFPIARNMSATAEIIFTGWYWSVP